MIKEAKTYSTIMKWRKFMLEYVWEDKMMEAHSNILVQIRKRKNLELYKKLNNFTKE